MPAAGGEPIQLETGLGLGEWSQIRWSPDSQEIAFVATDSSGRDIWKIPAAGGEPVRVTEGDMAHGFLIGLSWSPNGRHIAFTSNSGGGVEIWTVPVTGGEPSPVTVTAGETLWMDWSPDGKYIAFTSNRSPSGEVEADGNIWTRNIWKMSVTDGESEWLANGLVPAWSPDGSELIFMGGEGGIWKISSSGGQPQHLWGKPDRQQLPAWSPDGEQILFIEISGNNDIRIVDVSEMVAVDPDTRVAYP